MNPIDQNSVNSAVELVEDSAFIVIPAFNEAATLGEVVRAVRKQYRNVVVVDDGSRDDTWEVARQEATFALRHLINRGQGAALQTGIQFALRRGARFVVTFDADGQHRTEDISALLAPIFQRECDITLGSRFLGSAEGLTASKRLTLRMAVLFTRFVNGVRLTDAHNGLRAFSRRAAEQMNITLDRMAHASELIDLIARSGYSYKEVPVCIRYTPYSLEKGQSPRAAWRIAFHYLVGRLMG